MNHSQDWTPWKLALLTHTVRTALIIHLKGPNFCYSWQIYLCLWKPWLQGQTSQQLKRVFWEVPGAELVGSSKICHYVLEAKQTNVTFVCVAWERWVLKNSETWLWFKISRRVSDFIVLYWMAYKSFCLFCVAVYCSFMSMIKSETDVLVSSLSEINAAFSRSHLWALCSGSARTECLGRVLWRSGRKL